MNAVLERFIEKIMNPWIVVGFIGQLFFFSRFIVQWIASEKKKESVIPTSFWYFSLIGGVLLLAYSISVGDIVFTMGSSLNLIIYARNIVLIRHQQKILQLGKQ